MCPQRRLLYPEPPLTDGVALLRRWQEADAGCIESARSDPATAGTTTLPGQEDESGGLGWIHRQWARQEDGDGVSLAVAGCESGEALGAVVLLFGPEPGVGELGYWLAPEARGRGHATRAVSLVAGWALTGGGFARVEALIEPANGSSRRVLERAGFVCEGLLRSYLSVGERRLDALVFSLVTRDLERRAVEGA